MKKTSLYAVVSLCLFSLPFWVMACHWIAAYDKYVPSEYCCCASAQIYRTINGSTAELTENWSSRLYVPIGQTPENYAIDKIEEYMAALAPGFDWHYRNLNVQACGEVPSSRNNDGADCDGMLSPRIFGGPDDNRIVFDTLAPAYRYVSLTTYNDRGAIVDQVDVPITYADVSFAARPPVPGMEENNWPVLAGEHILFSDIYIELEDFNVTVEADGELYDVSITDCSLKNIGTVIAEYTPTTFRVFDAKFYMRWREAADGESRTQSFCLRNDGNIQSAGTAYWGPPYPSFAFSMTLTQQQLGMPMLFRVFLQLPSGAGGYDSHQPLVQLVDMEVFSDDLPVTVDIEDVFAQDEDDAPLIHKLYWIADFQDPDNERLIAESTIPKLYNLSFDSYGSYPISLVMYDQDGGYYVDTMMVDVRPPEISVLSPNGGECVEMMDGPGRDREISWSSGGVESPVKIELVCDDFGTVYREVLAESTENDGSFIWRVPLATHKDCRIKICNADGCTVGDQSDAPFDIVASDNCIAATRIFTGTYRGTLVCATNDSSACFGLEGQPDIWYHYDAQCPGVLNVNTCGTNDLGGVDLGMDTILSLHTACPQIVGDTWECFDDYNLSDDHTPPVEYQGLDLGNIRDSSFNIALEKGESALFRLTRYSGSTADDYILNVVFSEPDCRGDLTCDGDVDGDDLAIFAGLLGQFCSGGSLCEGDFDGDRDVDQVDLAIFAGNFGKNDPALCN